MAEYLQKEDDSEEENLEGEGEQPPIDYPFKEIRIDQKFFSLYDLNRKFKGESQKEEILIEPDFQRNPVWTHKQQSELIESILMDIPLPNV